MWCPTQSWKTRAWNYAASYCPGSLAGYSHAQVRLQPADDGMLGQQVFAGEATRMAYMTDEAVEGRDAFLQKRDPDWSNYPYYF